eukprot:g29421.t1
MQASSPCAQRCPQAVTAASSSSWKRCCEYIQSNVWVQEAGCGCVVCGLPGAVVQPGPALLYAVAALSAGNESGPCPRSQTGPTDFDTIAADPPSRTSNWPRRASISATGTNVSPIVGRGPWMSSPSTRSEDLNLSLQHQLIVTASATLYNSDRLSPPPHRLSYVWARLHPRSNTCHSQE